MSQRKSWRSCLTFLPLFFLSGLNSTPPPSPLFPATALPRPLTSLPTHLSSAFVSITPPLSFSHLSFCHFAPLVFSLFFPLFLLTPALSSLSLPLLSVSALQLTSVTRSCSCARMAGRAFRTRSASVLRSLRGCCANSPAARRARTATLPPPCTPSHC